MPSSRQIKAIGLVAFLTILIMYYVTNGERLTHSSEFYRKTVTAQEQRKDAEARSHVIEEERQRQERVERLQKEHEAAMASVTSGPASKSTKDFAGPNPVKQQPILDDTGAGKSVAGRRKMKDGKVVDAKPATDSDDGVAKVGNVVPKSSSISQGQADEESERQQEIEAELNDILKKGPIIIFSKSHCPFSKKAKHILLENYTITPPPYVVELDLHELGSGLQHALLKSTGRRTVPNVLINGKSIGGGDDVEALHVDGKLIETVQAMGGKRIMSIQVTSDAAPQAGQRAEVKFKA